MEVQSKWSLIFSGHLGPEIEVVFLMKGQVLQHLREHRKVPGWRSEDRDPITKELRKLLSPLNETSSGSLKIGEVSGSVWSIMKFLKGELHPQHEYGLS